MTDFMHSLEVMGKGMAGIFAVLILIALIIALLTKLTSKKEK